MPRHRVIPAAALVAGAWATISAQAQPAPAMLAGTCLEVSGTVLRQIERCTGTVTTVPDTVRTPRTIRAFTWASGRTTSVHTVQEVFLVDDHDAVPVGGTLGISCLFDRVTELVFCFFDDP